MSCTTLQVSRSGYYHYVAHLDDRKQNDMISVEMKALHTQSRASYGSRRMAKALQSKGLKIGRYRARSLMRECGLVCKQRRRYKVTTRSNPDLVPVDNVLNRNFDASTPKYLAVLPVPLAPKANIKLIILKVDLSKKFCYSSVYIGVRMSNCFHQNVTVCSLIFFFYKMLYFLYIQFHHT